MEEQEVKKLVVEQVIKLCETFHNKQVSMEEVKQLIEILNNYYNGREKQ
jgi:hypothetical protein